jgi:molybdopterin synthase catalytic subunit
VQVVTFSGDVRDDDRGRAVRYLTYEGHPSAERVLTEVAADIAGEFDVIALASLPTESAPSRSGSRPWSRWPAAGIAVRRSLPASALVDLTKERLPVWKHQVFEDGTDEWVNCA